MGNYHNILTVDIGLSEALVFYPRYTSVSTVFAHRIGIYLNSSVCSKVRIYLPSSAAIFLNIAETSLLCPYILILERF